MQETEIKEYKHQIKAERKARKAAESWLRSELKSRVSITASRAAADTAARTAARAAARAAACAAACTAACTVSEWEVSGGDRPELFCCLCQGQAHCLSGTCVLPEFPAHLVLPLLHEPHVIAGSADDTALSCFSSRSLNPQYSIF